MPPTRSTATPTAERARAPSTRSARRATGSSQGRELTLTNLDKVLFPGPRRRGAGHQARPRSATTPMVAPVMLPYLVDRPVNLHRFPNGVDKPGFWHKAVPSPRAGLAARGGATTTPGPGETEWYFVLDGPPALAWLANYGASSCTRGRRSVPDVHQPTWAYIDIDPGTTTTFDDVVLLARLYHTALDHLGVRGVPEGDRPARHPDLGADRAPATPSTTPGRGSRRCRAPSAPPCPSS